MRLLEEWLCLKGVNNPFAAVVFSPFIAFKITAIHIKTTREYSHYKRVQNEWGGGWGGNKNQTTEEYLCGRAGTFVFVLPCKRSPNERHTHPGESVAGCERARQDSVY